MKQLARYFQAQRQIWKISPLFFLLALVACKKDPATIHDPGEFSPLIETLEFQDGILFIKGDFGTDPGVEYRAVNINEAPLASHNISTWQNDNIICQVNGPLPDEITVQVINKGRKSNKKMVSTSKKAMKISYLQVVDEYDWLNIYGENFGTDPGVGKRTVTIAGVPVQSIDFWTPTMIRCIIPRFSSPGSYGKVTVTAQGAESASRTLFVWQPALHYTFPQCGLSGSLLEEAFFELVIRGDSATKLPPNFIKHDKRGIGKTTYCLFRMGGSGHSSYENCNLINIDWADNEGKLLPSLAGAIPANETHFEVAMSERDDAWEIRLKLHVLDAVTATKKYTYCNGSSDTKIEQQIIDFVTFYNQPIQLKRKGVWIEGDTLNAHNVASSAGFIWDAADYQANLVTVKLGWHGTLGYE